MLLTRPEQLRIDLPLEAIARVCEKYGVSELAVFGSVLRDDFDPARCGQAKGAWKIALYPLSL